MGWLRKVNELSEKVTDKIKYATEEFKEGMKDEPTEEIEETEEELEHPFFNHYDPEEFFTNGTISDIHSVWFQGVHGFKYHFEEFLRREYFHIDYESTNKFDRFTLSIKKAFKDHTSTDTPLYDCLYFTYDIEKYYSKHPYSHIVNWLLSFHEERMAHLYELDPKLASKWEKYHQQDIDNIYESQENIIQSSPNFEYMRKKVTEKIDDYFEKNSPSLLKTAQSTVFGFAKGATLGFSPMDVKKVFLGSTQILNSHKYFTFEISALIDFFKETSTVMINHSLFYGSLLFYSLLHSENEFYESLESQERETMDQYFSNYYLSSLEQVREHNDLEFVEGITRREYMQEMWKELLIPSVFEELSEEWQ